MTRPQPAALATTLPEQFLNATRDAAEMRPLRRIHLAWGAILGLALFFLHQAGTISGILHPAPGYEPAWALRSLDLPQYVTWITAIRSKILLPDYHAPWITEPAMFQPLFIAASWIPLPPLAAYYTLSAALYMCAGVALFYALAEFCTGLEWYALLASACAVPFGLLIFGLSKIFHSQVLLALGLNGMINYSYNSADGLLRGGQAATLTLSVGTALMLFFMGLLVRYVRAVNKFAAGAQSSSDSTRPLAVGLAIVAFASAFFHPFEIFVMIAASAVPLYRCGRLRVWLGIAAAGVLGMTPYLVASGRSEWLRDVAGSVPDAMYPFWIPENFGFAFVLLTYFLLMRFRMEDEGDRVLQSWFLATIALALIPKFTLASHLFDGFVYCIGALLVRRLASDRKLLPLIVRHRRGVTRAVAGIAAFSFLSLFVLFQQIWQDGRRADPEWMLNAVRPVAEKPLLNWLQAHAEPHQLVLSPPDLAPWIATVPVTSFASHDLFSLTFDDQVKLANAFYHGDDVAHELLENYGVGFVVAPAGSPAIARLPAAAYRGNVGPWRIYEFPDARMKPYPGLAQLNPGMPPPLRVRILELLHFFR
jgi:hypothetical protein